MFIFLFLQPLFDHFLLTPMDLRHVSSPFPVPRRPASPLRKRLSGKQAIERGELKVGSTLPIEALGGNVFPCTPPPAPLFSGPLMSAVARRPLDRYLGVTDRQVLELEAHRTRMNHVRFRFLLPLGVIYVFR